MKALLHVAPWLSALVAAGATLSSPAVGRAQSCETGADCPDGYRCRQESYESCYSYDECGPDGACSQTEQVCTTSEYGYCTYATCESDGDCPDTARCQPQITWVCDGSGAAGASGGASGGIAGAGSVCPPGEMCAPAECYEEPGESLCIPRYSLPCEVSEDCGGGFDCVQSSYWECDGSGAAGAGVGTAGASGGGEMLPPPPTDPTEPLPPDGSSMGSCHEVPSEEHYCQLQDLPCESDDECPSGLDCIDQYVWLPCTGSGGAAGDGAAGAAPLPVAGSGGDDGMVPEGADDFSCPDPELQRRCMPAEWGGGYAMSAPPGSASGPVPGTGMTGGGTSDGESTPDEGGGVEPPSDPAPGASGAAGNGGSDNAAETEPTSVGSGEVGDDDVDEAGGAPGLCAAGGPINADPSTWLLLGLTALVLRRRARH